MYHGPQGVIHVQPAIRIDLCLVKMQLIQLGALTGVACVHCQHLQIIMCTPEQKATQRTEKLAGDPLKTFHSPMLIPTLVVMLDLDEADK